jgi:hypothetical protein
MPLAEILKDLLEIGQNEMNLPIEIEFAVNMNDGRNEPHIFNLLQIRPIVETDQLSDIAVEELSRQNTIIWSKSALGNGVFRGIRDVVYIRPDTFRAANSEKLALQVEKLNEQFRRKERCYVLIGPGRWGSSDPWLGIPVKWAQISQARVIIESGLENYRIDPSQGTHFFQNLTSFRVGYMTINPFINDGFYNIAYLESCASVYEDEMIRHVAFDEPLDIKIDGKTNRGVILMPEEEAELNGE